MCDPCGMHRPHLASIRAGRQVVPGSAPVAALSGPGADFDRDRDRVCDRACAVRLAARTTQVLLDRFQLALHLVYQGLVGLLADDAIEL